MDAITALKDRPQTQAGEKSRAKGAFSRLLSPIRIYDHFRE